MSRRWLDGTSAIQVRHLCTASKRSGGRSLDVHAVVDNIRNELRMSERLIQATHDTEANVLVALLHEGGDNGVEWALAPGSIFGDDGSSEKRLRDSARRIPCPTRLHSIQS
jgi:hypothetical protein